VSAAGRFFWTPHAVNRAIERLWPMATYEEALGRLVTAAESAHLLRVEERGEIWRARRPLRFRFIVGASAPDGLPPVLTVIPPHDRFRPC
jgi:hypothetical protein